MILPAYRAHVSLFAFFFFYFCCRNTHNRSCFLIYSVILNLDSSFCKLLITTPDREGKIVSQGPSKWRVIIFRTPSVTQKYRQTKFPLLLLISNRRFRTRSMKRHITNVPHKLPRPIFTHYCDLEYGHLLPGLPLVAPDRL